MSRLRSPRRRRDDRGVIIPLTAMMITTLLVMTSFAVDLGRLRAERRDLQADADALALDAVQKMQGLTRDAALSAAIAEANASAARNDLPATLTAANVSVGFWNVETQELCGGPVVAVINGPDTCSASAPDQYPDAVKIVLDSTIPMYFDLSADERSVTREAVAVARAQTKGRLGSVFAGIQLYDPAEGCDARAALDAQMTFMNHLFTEYFDIEGSVGVGADTGTVSCDVTGPSDGLKLDALSWQGLAFSEITLGELATQFGLASPEELLASRVTASDLLTATADALDQHGNVTEADAAANLRLMAAAISNDIDGMTELEFGDIASGGTPADCADADGEPKPCAAEATINVLQMLHAAALAMDGENFAAVDLPVDIPFVGPLVSPRISIIETPQVDMGWKYAGQEGPRTAQVKVAVDIPLSDLQLDLGLLGVLGLDDVVTVDGNIPLVIEVARADALYQRVACSPAGRQGSLVDMLVDTGAVSIGFGAVSDVNLQNPADVPLVSSPLLAGNLGIRVSLPLLPPIGVNLDLAQLTNVSGRQTAGAEGTLSGGYDANINVFGAADDHQFQANAAEPYYPTPWFRYNGGISGTSVTDAAFAALSLNAVSSGLLGQLSLIGTSTAAIHDLLKGALDPVMDAVGDQLVDNLLTALGITLAGADGRIDDVRCQVPALANRG